MEELARTVDAWRFVGFGPRKPARGACFPGKKWFSSNDREARRLCKKWAELGAAGFRTWARALQQQSAPEDGFTQTWLHLAKVPLTYLSELKDEETYGFFSRTS